jgi:hypothetical protein
MRARAKTTVKQKIAETRDGYSSARCKPHSNLDTVSRGNLCWERVMYLWAPAILIYRVDQLVEAAVAEMQIAFVNNTHRKRL